MGAMKRPVDTPNPSNLGDWDLIVINSSAGKDSQALLSHMVKAADAQGVLDRVVVVHADLGRVEWAGTKALVYTQAAAYGLDGRTFDVARPQGDLIQQIKDRAAMLERTGRKGTPAWPDSKNRYCTSDQKRGQCAKVLTLLVDEIRRSGLAIDTTGPVRVMNCLGFRAQESRARAKRAPLEWNGAASNGKRHVWNCHPILAWSEAEVHARIDASNVPSHPAYHLGGKRWGGMPRLSCVFCVFAPKSALVIAAKANPNLFAEYRALESIAGTFRHEFSLAEVAQAIEAGDDAQVTAADAAGWNM